MTIRASTGLAGSVIAALYALLGAAWIGFAWGVVPSIIAAAHAGRSLPLLNQHLGPRLPLAYYLERWVVVSTGVILALVVHLCLLLVISMLDARRAVRSDAAAMSQRVHVNRTLLAFSLVFLVVTAISGARHDYFVHLAIWKSVLQGANPWLVLPGQFNPVNTYGPLFNAMAVLVPVHELAPKLLLAAAYLLFVIWLVKIVGARHGRGGLPHVAVLAWIVNPLPWMEVAYNGHFDILVGLLCVAAVQARTRGADGWSGATLGIGALLKFLPIVVLPFLAVERRRIRFGLVLTATLTMLAGVAVSVLLWGSSVLGAVSYTVGRRSDLLSIFRFLRGEWSPLRPYVDPATVDAMATPVLAIAGLLVFAWAWMRSVDPAKGAVLAVLTTVIFYHVGYVQYRFVLFVLVSYWLWTSQPERPSRDPFLSFVIAMYFGSLAVFDVFYTVVGGAIIENTRWGWIQEIAGAPAFLMEAALLVAVMRSSRVAAPPRSSDRHDRYFAATTCTIR